MLYDRQIQDLSSLALSDDERSLSTAVQNQDRDWMKPFLTSIIYDDACAEAFQLRLVEVGAPQKQDRHQQVLSDSDVDLLFRFGPDVLSAHTLAGWLLSPAVVRELRSRFLVDCKENGLSEYWQSELKRFEAKAWIAGRSVDANRPYSRVLVRRAIEMPFARSAAALPDGPRFRLVNRLRKILSIHEELAEAGCKVNTPDWVDADIAFHAEIILSTGSPSIVEIFRDAHKRVHELLLPDRLLREGASYAFVEEHSQILKAINAGELGELENAYNNHLGRLASDLGDGALRVYCEAKRDREAVSYIVQQRIREPIHRLLQQVDKREVYLVLIKSDITLPREFRDRTAFSADIAISINRGAKFLYVVDKSNASDTCFQRLFEELFNEVKAIINREICDYLSGSMMLVFGDTNQVVDESRDDHFAWPFGILLGCDGKLDVNCWDSATDEFVSYAKSKAAAGLKEEMPSRIRNLADSFFGDMSTKAKEVGFAAAQQLEINARG